MGADKIGVSYMTYTDFVNQLIEFDPKTGIGDLLFVDTESDLKQFLFCRIKPNVEDCYYIEFKSESGWYAFHSPNRRDGQYATLMRYKQWGIDKPDKKWRRLSLNQPPYIVYEIINKMNGSDEGNG